MSSHVPTSLLSSDLAIKSRSDGVVEAVLLTLDGMKNQGGFWGRGGIPSAHQTPPFPCLQLPSPLGSFLPVGTAELELSGLRKVKQFSSKGLLSFPNGNAFMSREKSFLAAQFKEEKGKKKR